ncbi:DUF29 domain-containing protein [Tumidithrix helvetica PCC 7403]|uniref:DUF29 domain-containing protein n=1 Tax=Tumidithrix helvetica TaxID=3457545 RepID=UPI003C81212F
MVTTPTELNIPTTLYDLDYCLWVERTIQLLREGKFSDVDIPNLLEELDDMSGSQRDALESNLAIILMHLLKYAYQKERRSNSWRYTLVEHRQRIERAFRRSPSLKRYYQEVFEDCYKNARQLAAAETGLEISVFPEICPFTQEQALSTGFLPE